MVGIDDWAWRRGQRYGTLIVDLERNQPLDLLPDRDAETVAAWLRQHPGIEVVARDRAGAYADGIRKGAPVAVQVADRWHLLRNLGDSVARALERHGKALRAAAAAVPEISTAPVAPITPTIVSAEPRMPDPHALRRIQFNDAMTLHAQGCSARKIARAVGVNRQTVQGWLRSGELPTWQQRHRGSSADRHADHLDRRWREGCHNAAQLWREVQRQGFRGRLRTIQRWLRDRRETEAATCGQCRTAWPMPSKQRASWLILVEPERLGVSERRFVEALLAGSPELQNLSSLARRFRIMVRERRADELDRWLTTAAGSTMAGFAAGIRRDLAPVRAALTLPWNTGPVEGQISRLKTIKRQMCGRAGFELLRQRVLQPA